MALDSVDIITYVNA